MKTFVERHAAKIRGTLSCFDRVVITGTLPDIAHAGAMAAYLTGHHVRLFDYPRWATPLREEIRARAERVARGRHGHRVHSAWKWTLTLSAEPNRWMAVMAPHWPARIPSRAARRSPAKTLRMNTSSTALVKVASKAR